MQRSLICTSAMLNVVAAPARTTATSMWIAWRSAGDRLLRREQATWQDLVAVGAFLVRRVTEVLCVQASMIADRRQFQVLWTIVQFVTIAVVDMLARRQRSAQDLFQKLAMLRAPSTASTKVSIAVTDVSTLAPLWRRYAVLPQSFVVLVTQPSCNSGGLAFGDSAAYHLQHSI